MVRFTRRELTKLLAASPLAAQAVPPVKQDTRENAPQTVQQALDLVGESHEKLRALEVPMSAEPAFSFKA
jgi:hypothetical protein